MTSFEVRQQLPAKAPTEGVANLTLLTRFGTGVSALNPFDAARERRRQERGESGGARLGELLLNEGVLTAEELEEALEEQSRSQPKKPLGEILLASGRVSPPLLVRLLAQQCQLELEEEQGFGTGLRRAIELRQHGEREQPEQPSSVPAPPVPAVGPRLLGELLVEKHLLTNAQLRRVLAEQEETGQALGELVVDRGYVSMPALVGVLTEQLQVGERLAS
jgi:hypothetical protein